MGADSATNTGATTMDTPTVTPSSSRAASSVGTENARPDSSENTPNPSATSSIDALRPIRLASAPPPSAPTICPTTTAVVTSSWSWVLSWNSVVSGSRAPAMLDWS